MAVPRKLVVVPNAATRELWRIAETGEMDELEDVLARADINARNEHGMTALMRAAYHGRMQMVRTLLEHGADPNLTRNDNFTALSLAAFFGHAEIVDLLMGHGAKTDVVTRFGTSPKIWARARSFGDVAQRLEKRSPEPKEPVFARPVTPVRAATSEPAPVVVRTLKDPPEIWDLVQETPRNFDARSAFMARMGSRKALLTVAVVLVMVIGAGAGGAGFYLKKRVPVAGVPAPPAATVTVPAPIPATVVKQTPETTGVVPETPAIATAPPTSEVLPGASTNPNGLTRRRSRSFPRPEVVSANVNNEQPAVETPAAPPTVVQAKPEPRTSATADTKKPTAPVNSQVISPSKTAQPKAKVIQWP